MENENIGRVDTISEKIDKISKYISDYENNAGVALPKNHGLEQVESYLNLTQQDLKHMTPENCGEAAYILARHATYIQRVYNEQQMRFNWAESNLKAYVSKQSDQYKFKSFEEKCLLITNYDNYAADLYKVMKESQAKKDRLEFLSTKIGFMSKTLLELQQSKRSNKE